MVSTIHGNHIDLHTKNDNYQLGIILKDNFEYNIL